jgi:hypothetical protein
MFTSRLKGSLDSLRPPEPRSPWSTGLYLSRWNAFQGSEEPDAAVVACDGSAGESSFSGGLVAWVARAMAHIYGGGGSFAAVPEVAVEVGFRLAGQPLFAKALELQTLRAAVERAARDCGRVFAVLDGSLYLTFLHHASRLEVVARVFQTYVRELVSLLETSRRSGAVILGVSKDSDVSYLRARILLDALLQADPSVGAELAVMGRSVKRVAERLGQKVEGLPPDAALRLYLRELEVEVSDEGLYGEVASEPGFTTPMLLAPQIQFATEEIRRGTRNWWESAFRRRLQRSEHLSQLSDLLDGLYALPPTAVFYWRPPGGAGVYRVDAPSNLLGHLGRCGDLSEDVFTDDRGVAAARGLVAALNWLSRGPYAVTPLTEVDAVVRLDRRLYKQAYEPVIVDELRRKGFKASPRKRSVRDLVLRGY